MKTKNGFWKIFGGALAILTSISLFGCGGGGGSDGGTGTGATPSSSSTFSSFSINGSTGVVNNANKTITISMPYGTSTNALVAKFTSTGSSVAVGTTPQVSESTSNNFTNPVVYVVTAADGSTSTYTVTVTVASINSKAITNFSINGVSGLINEDAKSILVTLGYGTSVTSLAPSFSTTGTNISVGGIPQLSGSSTNNFTTPVSYVVTAADGSTTTYVVTVNVATASSKALTSFSLNGTAGTINETSKTVNVALASGTTVSSLIAIYNSTGTSVTVSGISQESGITSNNFTSPVIYTVNAADSSTTAYTVTVTVAAAGPAPVALGMAGNFVLFSNAGMSSSPDSAITGDVGVGPGVTSTAITTGFTLTQAGPYATAPQVTGKVYAFNYAGPTPAYIVSSSNDMGTAYDDARGRLNPNFTNLGGTNLAGLTLAPGLYKWSSGLNLAVNTTVTLNGGPNDIWILQVAGDLTTGANSNVVLTGGAVPENVFWQLDTALSVGATSSFKGVVLAGSAITIGAGSTVNGRLLAKTAITMDSDAITQPAH